MSGVRRDGQSLKAMIKTRNLCLSEFSERNNNLFQELEDESMPSLSRRAEISYIRAEAIAKAHDLTIKDIMTLSPKYWNVHTDPIVCLDSAATTLLTIQLNLVVGTLTSFMKERQDIRRLADDLLKYRKIGQFCLTEVDRGLDIFYMRTRATLLDDGSFDLHTPVNGAAKIMPPTIPVLGKTCVAIVFAQLVVKGEYRGPRPFLVQLNDGHNMCKGITAKLLPARDKSAPVNHSITSFNHVNLPASSLLGGIETPKSVRLQFLSSMWRIPIGGLGLSAQAIPALEIISHIGFRYSMRRKVHNNSGSLVPILSFRTQQIPVYTALAQSYVLKAFYKHTVDMFVNGPYDPRVKHGISTCLKAVMVQHCQSSHIAISARCGAQGLFDHNQIMSHWNAMCGIAIAEGDVLVLSIRLASELLLKRYSLPESSNTNSPLSLHEQGLMSENRATLAQGGGHRSGNYASLVLPHCQEIVEAIGHRMAYDAAVASGVPQALIDLYVCNVIRLDLAWYVENGLLTRDKLNRMEDAAISSAQPFVEGWVNDLAVESYIRAPIVDDQSWKKFVARLKGYYGDSDTELEGLYPAVRAML